MKSSHFTTSQIVPNIYVKTRLVCTAPICPCFNRRTVNKLYIFDYMFVIYFILTKKVF